jgi:Flp pilus assembly pilin Flp
MVRLWRDQDGLTATEYSLLLALLIVAAVAAFSNLGGEVQSVANEASDAVHGPGGGMGCAG